MAMKLAACVLFLLLLTAGSLTIGHYPVHAGTALSILASKFVAVTPYWSPAMETVVCSIRLPRILAAVLIGAALSVSGAAYQGLFRNPLVSPDILGVSAGAGCGAALAMLFNQSVAVIEAAAFIFALAAVGISYLISRIFGRQGTPVLLLILSGMIIGTLFNSFVSITKLVADPNNTLPAITFWLMGSLATISAADVTVIAGPILLGLVGIYLLRWNLNVMAFGEEEARSMGVETQTAAVGRHRLRHADDRRCGLGQRRNRARRIDRASSGPPACRA